MYRVCTYKGYSLYKHAGRVRCINHYHISIVHTYLQYSMYYSEFVQHIYVFIVLHACHAFEVMAYQTITVSYL